MLETTVDRTWENKGSHIVLNNMTKALKEWMINYTAFVIEEWNSAVNGIHYKPLGNVEELFGSVHVFLLRYSGRAQLRAKNS